MPPRGSALFAFCARCAMVITKGRVLDRQTARVALNMLAREMSKGMVADLCETSISSIDRVRRYSERNNGAVRDPRPGKGKQGDDRWHFGGAMGLPSSMLLDRVAGGMDASSTHEEIYDEYCCVCPQPQPAFSTTSTHLRKLGYTTKRLSSWNPARNDARCAAWYARVKALFPRRQLLCVDEVGCNKKAANRNRGSSKRGCPAVTHLNVLAGGRKYSGLGIFSESGFEGMHVVDGAFDKESFLDAIDRSVVRSPRPPGRAAPAHDHTPLAHNCAPDPWQLKHMTPWPGPRSVLLIDNCRIHSVKELSSRVEAIGAKVIFLEPYDPQHMPIEVGFRALKRCAMACQPVTSSTGC
jgi:hypothetical protein